MYNVYTINIKAFYLVWISRSDKKLFLILKKANCFFTLRPYIRVIPQGTVDNNLGPDRLAGPKALAPNYCRSANCAWY